MRLPVPRGRKAAVLVAVAALLVAFRLCLPAVVEKAANHILKDQIPGYTGRVQDVDLHLWRGAAEVRGIDIRKSSGKVPTPFFSADGIDASIHWKELFHGFLVGKVLITRPRVNFVQGAGEEDSQTDVDKEQVEGAREAKEKLFPLRINRFEIRDGEVRFRTLRSDPPVNVFLRDVDLVATNLTNSENMARELMATVRGEGRAMTRGRFTLDMELNPLASTPTFKLAFQLQDLDMTELNDFFRHYSGVDVRSGSFGFSTEAAAADGGFEGYVKPVIRDLNVVSLKRERLSFGRAVKKAAVEAVAKVLENDEKEQIATKVPFSGRFDRPDIDLWSSVVYLLRNAFIRALPPGIEGTIRLADARTEARK